MDAQVTCCDECGDDLWLDALCLDCMDEDEWLDLARDLVAVPADKLEGTLGQLVLTAIVAAMFAL